MTAIMKAILYTEYGSPDVLQLKTLEKPIPKDNEILVRVHASTVTSVDSIFRSGKDFAARLFTGLTKPKNPKLGGDFAGEVEAVGKDVKSFKPGDPVFGTTGSEFGTHAEYACVAENGSVALKPTNVNDEETVALCDSFLTALPFLRDEGQVQAGQKVLINGASGAIGTLAVQLAKYFGATVTVFVVAPI